MSKLIKQNGVIEDIGGLIGFEATNRLLAIYGGQRLYIPGAASETHPIAKVIGLRGMQHLCSEFGSQVIYVPENEEFKRLRSMRTVAKLLTDGYALEVIAGICGVTTRQAHRYRVQAEEVGLIERVMGPGKRGEVGK